MHLYKLLRHINFGGGGGRVRVRRGRRDIPCGISLDISVSVCLRHMTFLDQSRAGKKYLLDHNKLYVRIYSPRKTPLRIVFWSTGRIETMACRTRGNLKYYWEQQYYWVSGLTEAFLFDTYSLWIVLHCTVLFQRDYLPRTCSVLCRMIPRLWSVVNTARHLQTWTSFVRPRESRGCPCTNQPLALASLKKIKTKGLITTRRTINKQNCHNFISNVWSYNHGSYGKVKLFSRTSPGPKSF